MSDEHRQAPPEASMTICGKQQSVVLGDLRIIASCEKKDCDGDHVGRVWLSWQNGAKPPGITDLLRGRA